MRDAIIIFVSIILAIGIGGYLYLYGTPDTPQSISAPQAPFSGEDPFVVLAEGSDAGTLTRRTNYRITTDEQFVELWGLIYGQGAPAIPQVNFSQYEVFALFDGSHSTGGYRVAVTRVEDKDGQRLVYLTREEPGEACAVASSITSPFQVVRVSKTSLPIIREESIVVNECR